MKLTAKDIIRIAIVTVASFPVLYFVMLFATGNARIEMGSPEKTEGPVATEQLRTMRMTYRRDSISAANSESFRALQRQVDSLELVKKQLAEQEKRTQLVKGEIEDARKRLEAERLKLESAVDANEDASEKKVKQLARVYGAMRPAEAARILETLDDDLVIKIVRNMGDDRQKGKIMGALSNAKASRISKKMGKPTSNGLR